MAKNSRVSSFSEVKKSKVEDLKENAEIAKQQVSMYQSAVATCESHVAAARAMLARVSQVDENGNPRGDVAHAQQILALRERQLSKSKEQLSKAEAFEEQVRREMQTNVQEIEDYKRTEQDNIKKLRRAGDIAYGDTVVKYEREIAERVNEAEAARIELLRCLGIEESPDYVEVDEVAPFKWDIPGYSGYSSTEGDYSSRSSGVNNRFDSGTVSAPVGGALGNIGNQDGYTGAAAQPMQSDRNPSSAQFTLGNDLPAARQISVNDLPRDVWESASDYQENGTDYNSMFRSGKTPAVFKTLKKIINNNPLDHDEVYYRRASLNDIRNGLEGVSPEDLVGTFYQFRGILSASHNAKLAPGDVVYEIKAPKGTKVLDLTNVTNFNEAMMYCPKLVVERVRTEGYNTKVVTVRVVELKKFGAMAHYLDKAEVEYKPPLRCLKDTSDENIVRQLSGKDKTEGSCVSLALAYVGCKAGYDMTDFKGGESWYQFAKTSTLLKISRIPGVDYNGFYSLDDTEAAYELLEKMEPDKDYILATGEHGSIVRKKGEDYYYLDMQCDYKEGHMWHRLDKYALVDRFRCEKRFLRLKPSVLIDTESLAQNDDFLALLGYINTK